MAILCKEHPPSTSKKCRFLSSVLKDSFSNCRTCHRRRLSYSSSEEENTPISDSEDTQEMIVAMIRSRAMESKVKRGSMSERYSSILHRTSGELFLGSVKRRYEDCTVKLEEEIKEDGEDENDEFTSVKSRLSHCSFPSVDDYEAFYSVRTDFSCCSSLKDPELAENKWWTSEVMDSAELRRRAIVQEIYHCKGWPFGLCRKTLLLPPLPRSPSESWSWCKSPAKVVKTH
ncbi:hypothetical protein RND81_05G058900 [Saponaria officinalis]|uniref:Uncharacterized protein n=1 Tax=Saponaria officinalis TaxID=3572 RepID=A0AAW1KU51_SAPOF